VTGESALIAGKARAESMMADTFTAYKPGTPTIVNGFKVPAYTSQGTTPGKVAGSSIQTQDTATRTVAVGGMELLVVEGGLHIPIAATVPSAGEYGTGWEYVLTTPGPHTDPALTASRWLVVSVPAKSFATARRLDVVRLA
jgi:hypothetical protein